MPETASMPTTSFCFQIITTDLWPRQSPYARRQPSVSFFSKSPHLASRTSTARIVVRRP